MQTNHSRTLGKFCYQGHTTKKFQKSPLCLAFQKNAMTNNNILSVVEESTKKEVSALATLLSIGVAIFFVVFVADKKSESPIKFYEQALQGAHVYENVVVGEKNYRIENGIIVGGNETSSHITAEIFRVAYAKTLARRSPIMALVGAEPDTLQDAITALADAREMLALHQKTFRERVAVLTTLYPLEFLTSLAQTERARLIFLESGNKSDLVQYELLQNMALKNYKRDIEHFKNTFAMVVPNDAPVYSTMKHIITRKGVGLLLNELEREAQMAFSTISERKLCLSGKTKYCSINDLEFPTIPVPKEKKISLSLLERAHTTRALYAKSSGDIRVLNEPIIALSESLCTPNSPEAPLFVLKKLTSPHSYPLYLNDLFLVNTTRQSHVQMFEHLTGLGISYAPFDPMVYYACPFDGYDLGKILAIRAIVSFAANTPMSIYATGEDLEVLKRSENNFKDTSGITTERSAVEYLTIAKKVIENNHVPENITHAVATLSLQLKNGGLQIEDIIRLIYHIEISKIKLVHSNSLSPLDTWVLFYTRSDFMTLFLPFSFLETKRLASLLELNTMPLEKMPFTTYSRAPEKRAIIENNLNLYYNFRREL